jgi:hypothetical protein
MRKRPITLRVPNGQPIAPDIVGDFMKGCRKCYRGDCVFDENTPLYERMTRCPKRYTSKQTVRGETK